MADWLHSGYNLHLDLFNFESIEADDSPYILTSPRSLEACTLLEIQPIELLHKDLMQFEEECLLTGQPLREAKRLYEEHEEQRLSLEFGQGDYRNASTHRHQRPVSAQVIPQRSPGPSRQATTPGPSSKPRRPTRSAVAHRTPTSPLFTTPDLKSKVRRQQERSLSSHLSLQSNRSRPSSAGSTLPEQDQKILDLLEKKYRKEKLMEETRQELRLAWDEQRQSEERSKVENEMQRRKNLADANRARQKKKEREERRRQLKKEQEMRDAAMGVQHRDMYHARLVKEQQALTQHQIQLSKLEDAEKRKKQCHTHNHTNHHTHLHLALPKATPTST
ncbi:coiled-coil domain-containing protein 177-like [Acanthaster planci]|uniref:Coiled-coil domain-containing protein 177-like n=1 Tax=Acanthaster planci TaxID=133434 RepID=A0A8B7XGQ8_ACAPL|nr:coiled-coil domain-containing protein 177-like [Acanthaster planci]